MKQKIILTLMLLIAAFNAHAYDFEVDGIYYNVYGNNVTVIYKTLGQGDYSGDLVIPETVTYDGVTYNVKTINYRAFDGCTGLTSVSIPSSVTSIGGEAFAGCSALSSITVDSGNPKYDSRDNCNAIIETSSNKLIVGCNNTVIPNSVIAIGSKSFYGSGLTSILIPRSVTTIGERAFLSCDDLMYINVEDEHPVFDSRNNCNAIIETSSNKLLVGCMNTTIPTTVTYISKHAFRGCHSLTSITIPNSVTYIDEYAFYASGLTNVTIGNSVTTIGNDAFGWCTSLTAVSIPNSVKKIGEYAFASCKNLSSMTLPNSVTSIGICAFEGCDNLTSVTIPNHITYISAYMFRSCTSLLSIKIPDNAMYICEGAFEDCKGLTSVTIPNSVSSIGEYAFYGCSGLTNVTIGNSVSLIDGSAFGDCPLLAVVKCYTTTPPTLDMVASSFSNYDSATLFVPDGSLEAYRAHEEWGQFKRIVPFLGAGPGDINGDGDITVTDVVNLINLILDAGEEDMPVYCDVNGDGTVNIADITALINTLLNAAQ